MSIMSDEVVFKARASVLTHRNACPRVIRNFRRLNETFTRTGDLDPGILHTTHPNVRNPKIGVCNANAHPPWTRNVKSGETCVVNALSQNRDIRRKNPGAVERRAHHRNTAPEM